MIAESDYPALRRAMLRAILAHEARLGETAAQYRDAIVQAVAANGYALDGDGRELVSRYIDEVDTAIRAGLSAAVAPLAQAGRLGSEWIATQVADAYSRRWPDGLTLSRRVWAWGEDVRRGVSAALTEGVRLERSAGQLVYDLQRAIEAGAGGRFAIAATAVEDWAERLVAAGRRSVREPMGMTRWTQAVEEAKRHLDTLADGGTRRQARVAFERIVAGITAGREDLTERALNWWIYDRQLYKLRRIVRTEMSTAYHRGVIAASREDADVVGYRWQLSASHPRPDICDYYADVDFGLGAGVWPKETVPADKAHPHCMCSLTPTTRTMRKDGKRGEVDLPAFLDRVSPAMRAQMVPAWALEAHANGTPWSELLRPDGRWLMTQAQAQAKGVVAQPAGRLPEPVSAALTADQRTPQRPPVAAILRPGAAYHAAAAGGPHAGMLARYREVPSPMINRAIRSLNRRIGEHTAKIADPDAFLPAGVHPRERDALVRRKWPAEIARFREQIEVLDGILKERANG